MHFQAVILCGGYDSRLWPLSREQYPKQLLKLSREYTMLQAIAGRLCALLLDGASSLYRSGSYLEVGNIMRFEGSYGHLAS